MLRLWGSSAPFEGIIEDTNSGPVEAAWKIIKSKTSLSATTLSIFRHGKPFLSEGPLSKGGRYVCYPFAFCLKDDNKGGNGIGSVELSEYTERSLGSTPYFDQGLKNLFFETELGPASGTLLATGLRQLQRDHESGARKLAAVALDVLRGVLEHLEDPISLDGPWWRKACLAAWHLWKNGRPSMDAAIVSFLLLVLSGISTVLSENIIDSDLERRHCIREAFDNVQQTIRSYTARISRNLASYMQSTSSKKRTSFTILTLSSSSTIRECIVQSALASGAPLINIHVLESRPLFEGVSMAASIISSFEVLPAPCPQVRITIFTDASVAQAATDVDLFLLGADRIAADGSVSNKTGSLPAAALVRHMAPGAETIVASEIYKVAMQSSNQHNVENNDASEVMGAWERTDRVKGLGIVQDRFEDCNTGETGQPTVSVQNVYFEWVPPSLIDTYICEDGLKTSEDFQRQAQWVSEQCGRYFGI